MKPCDYINILAGLTAEITGLKERRPSAGRWHTVMGIVADVEELARDLTTGRRGHRLRCPVRADPVAPAHRTAEGQCRRDRRVPAVGRGAGSPQQRVSPDCLWPDASSQP